MAANLVQTSFRIRIDASAAQGGIPIWAAAQDTNAAINGGSAFRIRFAVADTGTTAGAGIASIYLYYSRNGAVYAPLSSGADISSADPTGGRSADGSNITSSLLTSTGAFYIGSYFSSGGTSAGPGVPNGRYNEYEFGMVFNYPACDGNAYAFQVQLSGLPLNSYTATPSFNMPNHALLAATEADDTMAGVGNVPRAALLNALEVSDNLTGSATALWPTGILAITEANDALAGTAIATPILGVLNATEANDVMHGSGAVIPIGGLWARLTATEANDVLAGLGTGSGDVGSLNAQEAPDSLVGAAMPFVVGVLSAAEDDDTLVSTTLLWANQWVESEGCPPSMWTPIDCGESLPPFPPIVPPGGGGGEVTIVMELTMEQLPVLSLNQIGNFSHIPNMELCTLTVDGRPFFPVGSPPDFSVSGSSITWLSSIYSVDPSSTVIAQYSWTSVNG